MAVAPRSGTHPAVAGRAVTPSDEALLPNQARSLYVGYGGDIRLTFVGDDDPETIPNVGDGSILPFQVVKVWETGTTASGIIALS